MKIHPLGKITDAEKALVKAAVPQLATNIETVSRIFFIRGLEPEFM